MKRYLPALTVTLTLTLSLAACAGNEPDAPVESSSSGLTQESSDDMSEDVFFVSTDGDDAASGSETDPRRTIQKAADTLQPGQTVYVKGGTYNEKVSVNVTGSEEGGYLTFSNYDADEVIIDGSGLEGDDIILIEDKSYIKIIGFELQNNHAKDEESFPKGIFVVGRGSHIELRDNIIHDITCSEIESGAHGIAVYGTAAPESLNNITVSGNEIYDCKLGWSESLVLNGNVEQFEVSHNEVHDNSNIGIDFIGFEGECPDEAYDQARDGVCSDNLVYNIDSIDNPNYEGERSADGIYVDGGRDIIIERNISHDNNIGIELASEHRGKSTSGIIVRDNLVYNSSIMGIAMGGYDTERGSSENNEISHNTLYNNDTDMIGCGELVLQFDIRNNSIRDNIIYANEQGLLISNDYAENSGNVLEDNVYYCMDPAQARFQWQGEWYDSFSGYQLATGNDSGSLFTDPLFKDPASDDFSLEDASPASGKGSSLLP